MLLGPTDLRCQIPLPFRCRPVCPIALKELNCIAFSLLVDAFWTPKQMFPAVRDI